MTPRGWVVLAQHARAFEMRDEAVGYAVQQFPSVVCEWTTGDDGRPLLRERLRYDKLWDEVRGEWRVMLG
ncbi:MAG: hypothetical protein HY907_08685 [Deltaproteobacteria bacterium]|nr:hypothetical protein [Deltaproteobacteria bacterium]